MKQLKKIYIFEKKKVQIGPETTVPGGWWLADKKVIITKYIAFSSYKILANCLVS